MANYSHHNSGRSWHLDRQKFNKNEDWEQPMRSRKLRYKSKRKPQEKKFLGIFEDGGMSGEVKCFLTNYIKSINNIYAKNPETEGSGLGWIPFGSKDVINENIKKQVNSLADLSFVADIPIYDGVWDYSPINEGAEIHFLQHNGYTKKGNLIFNKYVFIIECDKYDEDGEELDTFGIDWLEDACKKQNYKNGLVDNETNFQVYDYMNKFIEDEKEKIYESGGGVGKRNKRVSELLDEVTDYESVDKKDIPKIFDAETFEKGLDDDEIQTKINKHLIKLGYTYDSEKYKWVKKYSEYSNGGGVGGENQIVKLDYETKRKNLEKRNEIFSYKDIQDVRKKFFDDILKIDYNGIDFYALGYSTASRGRTYNLDEAFEIKRKIESYFDKKGENILVFVMESPIPNFGVTTMDEWMSMPPSYVVMVNKILSEQEFLSIYESGGGVNKHLLQDGDVVVMAFKEDFALEVYESDDVELNEPVEEIFKEGEQFEVTIFGVDRYKYDVQFGDGSVAFIRKENVDIISVKDEYSSGGGVGLKVSDLKKGDRLKKKGSALEVDVLEVGYDWRSGYDYAIIETPFGSPQNYIDVSNFVFSDGSPKPQYSKGGRAGKRRTKNYNYIPNRMIQSVEVKKGRKVTEIDGDNILDGVYVRGKVKFEGGGMTESDKENQVRNNLVDGRIEMNTLKEIIGCEPNYPNQIIGSIKLKKCFLLPYYRLA